MSQSTKVNTMQYHIFIESLEQEVCPNGLEPALQALWYEATGAWDMAHKIVQPLGDVMGARVHAYLHRKEGNEVNARYWHRHAGTVLPEDMSLREEWDSLVRELLE